MRRRIAADRRHRGRGLRRRVARAEGLQRSRDPRQGRRARAAPRGLPGDPDDSHSRYIEAEVEGPDRRLALSAQRQSGRHREVRLQDRAGWSGCASTPRSCLPRSGRRCCAATGTSCPRTATSSRCARPQQRRGDAARSARRRGGGSSIRAGPMRCARSTRTRSKLYTFWDYTAGCWQRDLGFRLDHLLCSPEAADRLRGAGVDRWARARRKRPTTRRRGWS